MAEFSQIRKAAASCSMTSLRATERRLPTTKKKGGAIARGIKCASSAGAANSRSRLTLHCARDQRRAGDSSWRSVSRYLLDQTKTSELRRVYQKETTEHVPPV